MNAHSLADAIARDEEKLRDFENGLESLKEQVSYLRERIRYGKAYLKDLEGINEAVGPALPSLGKYAGMRQKDAAYAVLRDNAHVSLKAAEVVSLMLEGGYHHDGDTKDRTNINASVYVALMRMANGGHVIANEEGKVKTFRIRP